MGKIKEMLAAGAAVGAVGQPPRHTPTAAELRIAELEAERAADKARIAELEAQLAECRAALAALTEQLAKSAAQNADLANDLELFRRQMCGPRSERIFTISASEQPELFKEEAKSSENSPSLAGEEAPGRTPTADAAPAAVCTIRRPAAAPRVSRRTKRKATGRDCLRCVDGLEVKEVTVTLPEEKLIDPATGRRLSPVDVDTRDQIAFHPGTAYIIRTHLVVYGDSGAPAGAPPDSEIGALDPARADDDDIRDVSVTKITAPMPPALLPNSKLAPSMQAYLILEKYGFHAPQYRLQEKLAISGVFASRQLLSSNATLAGEAMKPVYERMLDLAIAGGYMQSDSTGIKLQAKFQYKKGYVWIFLATSPDMPPYYLYHFSTTMEHEPVADYLRNFRGALTCDMWPGFWALNQSGRITVAGCWAHLRRKFYEAVERNGCPLSTEVLARMAEIWHLEKQAAAMPPNDRLALRQSAIKPIVTAIFAQLENTQNVPERPKDKTRIAINYALNHKSAFLCFLDDANVRVDNNPSERALRKIVIGRNNWQCFGSERAAKAAMVLISIVQTCRTLGIDPFAYLTDLLSCEKEQLMADVDHWLPDQWIARNPGHVAQIPQRDSNFNWASLSALASTAAKSA